MMGAPTPTCRPPLVAHRCILACILLSIWIASAADPAITDRDILEMFYSVCDGESWNENVNWTEPNTSICDWQGVDCVEAAGEQVERLTLANNNVACTLPIELFCLPELALLDLRTNDGITADFTALNASQVSKNLQYVILADTSVSSVEGIEVFSDSLTTLYMGGCELSGPFPASILQLSALKHLDLSYNFLSGALPDEVSNLIDLRTLRVAHNFFNGQLPTSFGSLQKLTQFQGQFNTISGTLPAEMGDMFSLSFVTLHNQIQRVGDNQVGGLTGPLLDFSTNSFLFHLDFSNNRLSGAVPSNLLDSLVPGFGASTLVDLRSNQLSGEVPASLARFDRILMYLADNLIESVPGAICEASEWLFGQVGEFGCNGFLCPPGTFSPFGRQTSGGFPCWMCGTGESSLYFGSKSCSPDSDASLDVVDAALSMTEVTSPFERLSKDPTLIEAHTPDDINFDGAYWRDGLDEDTTGSLGLQHSSVSAGKRTATVMGALSALVVYTMLMLP